MTYSVDLGGTDIVANTITLGATAPGLVGNAANTNMVDSEQYVLASANSATYNNTGLDTASAAPVFTTTMGGSANGAITLQAGKTYFFEACYNLTNTGTTSHTWATIFGGTATFSAGTAYQVFGVSGTTANTPVTGGLSGFTTLMGTAAVATAASTSATEQVSIEIVGTIVVNAAGTLIPQMQASARPGGTGTPGVVVKAGSFFRVWPATGTGTVGNWS